MKLITILERKRMGFGYFCSIFVLSLFFTSSLSQQPNTDEYFVSAFLHKMGFFNISTSVCSWKGVQCDVSKTYVLGLNVSNLGLSGLIPDNSIGKLSKLQILDLSNNKITHLPSDFWSLGSLKTLNLSSNQFSGYLPNNIGNFGQLQALDLSNNNFSGNIPESISSLASLKILKLSQNGFESSIPSGLTSCPSLLSIDLSSNHLRGSLPKGFFAAFPNLQSLNIAVNKIRGQESDFLGMSSIGYLNLSRNQFQVNLNYTFNWSNMVHLDLSENQFGGGILLGKLINEAKKLKQLNLAFNRFESRGFPKIVMLTGLEYLNLSGSNLTGHIPSEISKMKSLKILDLSFNNLSGDVPLKILDRLLLMERFNFSYNNLTLCDSEFSTEIHQSVFIGSTNSCPIAANPDLMRRKSHHHKRFTLALILTVSVVICLLVALLFLAFGYGYGCKRKKNNTWTVKKQESYKEETTISGPFSFQTDSTTWVADVKLATSVPVVVFEKPLLNFTFADLLFATSNFERGTLLAEGKFGPVYRGFLPGGIHIAVKVLVHGSTMADEEAAREFEYLGRIKHPNLVPLMGYCLAGDQRIAIYDYMENGNLQNLLHDLPLGVLQTNEDWSRDNWDDDGGYNGIQNVGSEGLLTNWRFRHKIALGTARALAFLHHGCSPPIIHRDVKASSVYLDSSLEPRLSYFGLSKIFGNGIQTECDSNLGRNLTPKSDVYGFGVILFELITGKKTTEDGEGNLVRWARGLVRRNEGLIMAIDPKIQGTGPDEHMEEVLKIGYLCTADLPSKRPSMQQVVGLLKDIDPLKNHP